MQEKTGRDNKSPGGERQGPGGPTKGAPLAGRDPREQRRRSARTPLSDNGSPPYSN